MRRDRIWSAGVQECRSGDKCTVRFVGAYQVMSALLHSSTPALLIKVLPFYLFTFLPFSLSAAPLVIPQQQAAHFCQLFVAENSSLSTLSRRAYQMISQPDDSLSVEQILAGYVLLADGWLTMRLFPHQEKGTVSWYSATDELPASIDSEHQKYIHEVFPRLVAEVQAGHWETVDAYIDRMIQYQCQFGGSKLPTQPSSAIIIGIFFLFFALAILYKSSMHRSTLVACKARTLTELR